MMRNGRILVLFVVLVCSSACDSYHHRPNGVPLSAVWVEHVFIDCSVEKQRDADRCTVYKDDTGEIIADGLWVLNPPWGSTDVSTLHYMAYGHDEIYLDDARALALISPSERDPQIQLLKQLATRGDTRVIDCNRTSNNGLNSEISKCALRAFAARQPFYVRYFQTGIDSSVWHAIAGDAAGDVTEIDYDSSGWFNRNLPKGFQVFDDGHIILMPCPKPVTLLEGQGGTPRDLELSCSRPGLIYK